MNENTDHGSRPIRREFLASVGSGLLLLKPETVFGSQANSAVEMGLIGCGKRGGSDAVKLKANGVRFVALHDPFQDALDRVREKLGVPDARQYHGLNGYRELLASSLDAVLVASPPYFHPEQAASAVDAGKHLFLNKPVAVDVTGSNSITASGKKAEGKLSFLTDFWFEEDRSFQECAERVKRGDIGTPAVVQAYYHMPRLEARAKPGMPASETRLRNWLFDKVLSGDIIVEQDTRALGDLYWILGTTPLKACGTGGRKVRVDLGDCWDNFVVCYDYPGGVKVAFSGSQFTKGFYDVCVRIFGSEGTMEVHHYDFPPDFANPVAITGDHPWKPEPATGAKGPASGPLNEKRFVESIRSRQYLNNAAESVNINLTAILGRMAAYKGKVITWDEMMRSGEKYELSLPGIA